MEASRIIEAVVYIPRFTIEGVARRCLVYGSTERGTYSAYTIDIETGVKKLVASDVHMLIDVSESSSKVVFVRDVSRGFELSRVFTVDIETGEELSISRGVEPQRIAGLAFDGKRVAWSGATREKAGIYLANLANETVERIAETKGREFVTDVNESYVVGFGHIAGNPFSTELLAVNILTGTQSVITPREGSINVSPRLHGSRVLFASNFEDGDTMALYTLDLEERSFKKATFTYRDIEKFEPVEYVSYGWTSDGRIWAVGKKRGTSRLFIDGRDLGPDTGFISSATVHERKAYIVHSTLRTPPKILEVDIESGSYRTIVDNPLPRDVAEKLGEARFIELESFDKLKIPTYVLESSTAPKPGPTVVYPHGGPWSEVANAWTPIVATLAALGYHVVAPNFRGSTGYGEKFRLMDVGDPGGADMEDVATAGRWAIDSGLSRVGEVSIVGYSYGGYTTLMQLTTRPKLWKCGVAGAPVADWEMMYELADRYFKTFQEVLFAGRKELFRERSPITYAENLESPLCVVQPQNDSRTPIQPVLEFIKKLIERGKTFELHVLPDIGHTVSLNNEALAKFLLYVAAFLARCYSK
ncbi:MAG: prolyl oligopeptidase family serine peptidase [Sulfolobales archaeon]|nr:prolyl oligopeptidase family serine peptidase [Sulfolobales archaeon]MDW8082357.1 prolyl oligopeptidase family serine peptidase [Sulfolobales archaeon]